MVTVRAMSSRSFDDIMANRQPGQSWRPPRTLADEVVPQALIFHPDDVAERIETELRDRPLQSLGDFESLMGTLHSRLSLPKEVPLDAFRSFVESLPEQEQQHICQVTLPFVARLAADARSLCVTDVDAGSRYHVRVMPSGSANRQLLTAKQAASLVATCFFCLVPPRVDEFSTFCDPNFYSFFSSHASSWSRSHVSPPPRQFDPEFVEAVRSAKEQNLPDVGLHTVARDPAFRSAQYRCLLDYFESVRLEVDGKEEVDILEEKDKPMARRVSDLLDALIEANETEESTEVRSWSTHVLRPGEVALLRNVVNSDLHSFKFHVWGRAVGGGHALGLWCSSGLVRADYVSKCAFPCRCGGQQHCGFGHRGRRRRADPGECASAGVPFQSG